MATSETNLGKSQESNIPSEESIRESELASIQHSLKFVTKLKEEFVCPICKGVVLNPQQNSCGHIYCFHCLRGLLESSFPSSPVCPVDRAVITPAEVFQDNCCKREISSLEVYCTNSPACNSVITLNQLQEHLRLCRYEQLQCTNPGCSEMLQRQYLQKHMTDTCLHRRASCPHCRQLLQISLIQNHVQSLCPEMEVECPYGCSNQVRRQKLMEHKGVCHEVHTDCFYKKFGCSVKDKRGNVKLHEVAAFSHHLQLVLKTNNYLEQKVEALQEKALRKQQELQTDELLTGQQKQVRSLLQQSSNIEHTISTVQRSLSRQKDSMSSIQLDVQQMSQELGPSLDELDQLKQSQDAVMQELLAAEVLREHTALMEENLNHHSSLLDLHTDQLSVNKQHLQELEVMSYSGRLIWKIENFRKKKEAEVDGQPSCLNSVSFHTGRCGYKMAIKAYLNGDGEGRGTHLSLYVVLMPGDFDALLPWPFRQTVSLSVLDQSSARNHQSLSFKPDPRNKCFQKPAAESNVAVGFPCFIPSDTLESPQNAAYIKDDTLFVKVKVDTAGLEQL
uniref:TNF receptor-associated factor n=2 Tax=Kryptolebias marmoratus TaxID=37003 RepID=A0A3Q3AZ57_KRYMA